MDLSFPSKLVHYVCGEMLIAAPSSTTLKLWSCHRMDEPCLS